MAFVLSSSFAPISAPKASSFAPAADPRAARAPCRRALPAARQLPRAIFSDVVDDFMAASVHTQYINKACPSGEPPIQCIEGTTANEPYDLRTLKRQSQLRFYQQPTAVKLHNMYEMRKAAVSAAHGCSHEEGRAVTYPKMAAAYVLGQAEADKACSRYFKPNNAAEDAMLRYIDIQYQKAVCPSGVFSTACTDGQAKYEAYLAQVRGKSTKYRTAQYSTGEKEAMKYAARKQAFASKGYCTYEEGVFSKFPIVAAAMRPALGYYPPYVKSPTQGYTAGMLRPALLAQTKIATAAMAAKLAAMPAVM